MQSPNIVPEMAKPPDLQICVLLLKQDDPRKCTAAKLAKFGFARALYTFRQIPRRSLLLNPIAPHALLPNDKNIPCLVAIDCSWEKASSQLSRVFPGFARKLPTLLAANPTNYAKKHKLSSAEALAAASFIIGYKDVAEKLLSLFKWGETFLTLNSEPLEAYSSAKSEKELSEIETQFF